MPSKPAMTDAIVAFVTTDPSQSESLSRTLVEEGLAACVNIISSVTSIYRFEGKLCADSEHLLVIKTERSLWESLKKRVSELHTYAVPEIICLTIEDGYKPYMEWMNSVLRLGK